MNIGEQKQNLKSTYYNLLSKLNNSHSLLNWYEYATDLIYSKLLLLESYRGKK